MFTVQKEVKLSPSYPEYGIGGVDKKELLTVTYTCVRISELLLDGASKAYFEVKIDGVVAVGGYTHQFNYSGSRSPFEAAEISLKEEIVGEVN